MYTDDNYSGGYLILPRIKDFYFLCNMGRLHEFSKLGSDVMELGLDKWSFFFLHSRGGLVARCGLFIMQESVYTPRNMIHSLTTRTQTSDKQR